MLTNLLTCRERLRDIASVRISAEVAAVAAELQLCRPHPSKGSFVTSNISSLSSSVFAQLLGPDLGSTSKKFLGILESDMQDDEDVQLEAIDFEKKHIKYDDGAAFRRDDRAETFSNNLASSGHVNAIFQQHEDYSVLDVLPPRKPKNEYGTSRVSTMQSALHKACQRGSLFAPICEEIERQDEKENMPYRKSNEEMLRAYAGGLSSWDDDPHHGFTGESPVDQQTKYRVKRDQEIGLMEFELQSRKKQKTLEASESAAMPSYHGKELHASSVPSRSPSLEGGLDNEKLENVGTLRFENGEDSHLHLIHQLPNDDEVEGKSDEGRIHHMRRDTASYVGVPKIQAARGTGHNTDLPTGTGEITDSSHDPGLVSSCTNNTNAMQISSGKVSNLLCLAADEVIWNVLCCRASGIVQTVRTLYRHHPDCHEYAGPIVNPDIDREIYEATYDNSVDRLQDILHDAEALLPRSISLPVRDVSILETECSDTISSVSDLRGIGCIHTHGGLKRAIGLFLYLARLLPIEDVRWRIERRLLGKEPLVDFVASDVRTRAIVLTSLLELIATLHRRAIPVHETATTLAEVLSIVATDMTETVKLLNMIIRERSLPDEDMAIGSWKLNGEQRERPLIAVFSELSALYAASSEVLLTGIRSIAALSGVLKHNATSFVTDRLIEALFRNDAGLTVNLKREALGMVSILLTAVTPSEEEMSANLAISAKEGSSRSKELRRICSLLQTTLIPYLEIAVQAEYQMRGDTARSNTSSLLEPIPTGGDMNESHATTEQIEVLAQCYSFLLADGCINWSYVEERISQPYSFSLFWKQANTAYRRFAAFMIAHIIANAPGILKNKNIAISALKAWVLSITDIGGRQCASYLTQVLASNHHTASLFLDVAGTRSYRQGGFNSAARSEVLENVLKRTAASGAWRSWLPYVLNEFDAVLIARKKEVEATAFEPTNAVLKWLATESDTILAVVYGCSAALNLSTNSLAAYSLRNQLDPVLAMIPKLLSRAAIGALEACRVFQNLLWNELNRSEPKEGHQARKSDFFATQDSDEADIVQLRSLGEVRKRLRSTSFSSIRRVIDALIYCGAPKIFNDFIEFLEPLACIIIGVLEIGSGKVESTLVDMVIFEEAATALTSSDSDRICSSSHVRAERKCLLNSSVENPRKELCMYVLNAFVRRALLRSVLPHITNERRAVNAIRLCQNILKEPIFRDMASLKEALQALIWPIIGALAPDQHSTASIGVKEATYAFLHGLVSDWPELLPRLITEPCAVDEGANIYNVFWKMVFEDSLACIAKVIPAVTAEQNISAMKPIAPAMVNLPAEFVLWPSTESSIANGRNTLLCSSRIGQNSDAVDKLLSRPAGLPLPQMSYGDATAFRAGDFPSKLALRALDLLCSMVSRRAGDTVSERATKPLDSSNVEFDGQDPGFEWVVASFPALHALIACAGAASRPLHASYREIRTFLGTRLGVDFLSSFPIHDVKQSLKNQASMLVSESKPNGAPSRDMGAGFGDAVMKECSLSGVLKASDGERINVVAILSRVDDKSQRYKHPTAVCLLQDFCDETGELVSIKLMTGQSLSPDLASQLIKAGEDMSLPLVVRVENAIVSEPSGRRVLVATKRTRVTFSPEGSLCCMLQQKLSNSRIL